MRAVLQRVTSAKVTVDGNVTGEIRRGLVVLLGVAHSDTYEMVPDFLDKICGLRIFGDGLGKMNLSLSDVGGEMLIVSQFTLFADTSKGRRPSFLGAAATDQANAIYEVFVGKARETIEKVETGIFGAMMSVELINDGPVTIILDTDEKVL